MKISVIASISACALSTSCAVSKPQETIEIRVDVSRDRHPISPLVYGVNFADAAAAKALNLVLNRSGGNGTTRYNWKLNASNSANDWFFMSVPDKVGGATPSASVDAFVRGTSTVNANSMVTIPLIGWAAKLAPNREPLGSFSVKKYGAQKKAEQWHPDFGNGEKPDGKPITGNDPTDANMPVAIDFYRAWVDHLVQTFGSAKKGGVAYYLLDNEAGLWHSTHRDVTPIGFKMDDYFQRAKQTAAMIKSVDPTSLVAGPEEWGWIGYLYSGYDSQWAAQHGYDKPRPDRTAHGDMDFSAWLLQQFAKEEKRTGKRLLDVFTLHYYPQSSNVFGEDASEKTAVLRMRSTRSLWDTNYTDESWINQKINLIPRMKQWVKDYYPGTKIGITEYSFGAEESINGAIAQADALGIFGREGVDLATRWVCPKTDTPTFRAIQLYRNYDGKNGSFGDTSVHCETSANPDNISTFAAQDSKSGKITIVVLNKQLNATAHVSLKLAGLPSGKGGGSAHVYQLADKRLIKQLADLKDAGNAVLDLPAQSATLLVLD